MNTKTDTTQEASAGLTAAQYDLPAYWASYLINGDDSGLEGEELYYADKFLAAFNLPMPVSCEPAGIGRFNGLMCDMETYTFLI
jgi:hypothetical protein